MTRGEDAIRRQLAAMDAAGLGDHPPIGMLPPARRRAIVNPWLDSAPGPREWWRLVVGVVLLAGGIALWSAGHGMHLPTVDTSHFPPRGLDQWDRDWWTHLQLEMLGLVAAITGVVWVFRQIRPRQRSYVRRDVLLAVAVALLTVVGMVLWFFAQRTQPDPVAFLAPLLVYSVQSSFITRMTGPNGSRRPVDDPRGAALRAMTPWPVVVGLSVAFCAWQAVTLVR